MNRNQKFLTVGLALVVILAFASFLPQMTSSTSGSTLPTTITENPYTKPIQVEGDLQGVGYFNYTYCGPECQNQTMITPESAAYFDESTTTTTRTCTSGMGPLDCYVYTHTNSNQCYYNCGTTGTYTASGSAAWCGPLCQYLQGKTGASGIVNASIALILLNFNDTTPTRTAKSIQDQWNRDIVSYYNAVSHGQYSAKAAAFGWYTIPYTEAYYGADCPAPGQVDCGQGTNVSYVTSWRLAVDGVAYAEAQGLDLSQYQYIVIVHAGNGEETEQIPSNDLWSVTYYNAPPAGSGDQGAFTQYSIVPETESGRFSVIGTWAAEFGHQQGWPDMFNAGESTIARTGHWELESIGAWNNNGNTPAYTSGINQAASFWLTEGAGITRITKTANTTIQLYPLESNDLTKTLLVIIVTSTDHEYFIELRTQTGYDKYVPGKGVIIGTVTPDDETLSASTYYIIGANSTDTTLAHAAWQPGTIYKLSTHTAIMSSDLEISIMSANTDGSYTISVVDT